MGNQATSETIVSGSFKDYYVEEETIGQGTFATVKKCYRKNDQTKKFAVK